MTGKSGHDSFQRMETENLPNQPFIELVRHRTSCRSYEPRPVPREHLELMLEAARLAPSACNKQPWRLAVVEDEAVRIQLVDKAFLAGIPMKWATDAGAIIALGMEKSAITHKVAPKISGVDYPLLDLGIAGEHLVLQAEELGLGTCWIGWIRPKAVRRIVGWPRGIEPAALITIGWPASRERKTRPRLEQDEIVKWIQSSKTATKHH
ncbi:MAG: nitroreductase family protein [Verrucomicrobiota bacterium]